MLSKIELFDRVIKISLKNFFGLDQLVRPEGPKDIVEMHSSAKYYIRGSRSRTSRNIEDWELHIFEQVTTFSYQLLLKSSQPQIIAGVLTM